jgi:hypothetical protein
VAFGNIQVSFSVGQSLRLVTESGECGSGSFFGFPGKTKSVSGRIDTLFFNETCLSLYTLYVLVVLFAWRCVTETRAIDEAARTNIPGVPGIEAGKELVTVLVYVCASTRIYISNSGVTIIPVSDDRGKGIIRWSLTSRLNRWNRVRRSFALEH